MDFGGGDHQTAGQTAVWLQIKVRGSRLGLQSIGCTPGVTQKAQLQLQYMACGTIYVFYAFSFAFNSIVSVAISIKTMVMMIMMLMMTIMIAL